MHSHRSLATNCVLLYYTYNIAVRKLGPDSLYKNCDGFTNAKYLFQWTPNYVTPQESNERMFHFNGVEKVMKLIYVHTLVVRK